MSEEFPTHWSKYGAKNQFERRIIFRFGSGIGGDGGIRTPDRVIMIHLLCRLSYIAFKKRVLLRCGKTFVL